MFVSLQWENRWVFLQLWPFYVPGFDMKWKLFCKYSTSYCEWFITVFFVCLMVSSKCRSFETEDDKLLSVDACRTSNRHLMERSQYFSFFNNLLHRIKDPSVLLFHCNFKPNRFPLCLFDRWRLRSSKLLFVFKCHFILKCFNHTIRNLRCGGNDTLVGIFIK